MHEIVDVKVSFFRFSFESSTLRCSFIVISTSFYHILSLRYALVLRLYTTTCVAGQVDTCIYATWIDVFDHSKVTMMHSLVSKHVDINLIFKRGILWTALFAFVSSEVCCWYMKAAEWNCRRQIILSLCWITQQHIYTHTRTRTHTHTHSLTQTLTHTYISLTLYCLINKHYNLTAIQFLISSNTCCWLTSFIISW